MKSGIRLIYGVGLNDVERKVTQTLNGKRVWCPIYKSWHHMLERCYSQKRWEDNPSYVGCKSSSEWLRFSCFEEWMLTQDWEGKNLDKDILFPGNKIYSSDTCIFIDQGLNKFLVDRRALRGEYPLGVSVELSGLFKSRCWNPFTGEREYLGIFKNADDAHLAWKKRKHELALMYADQQTDPRIAEALRTRYL